MTQCFIIVCVGHTHTQKHKTIAHTQKQKQKQGKKKTRHWEPALSLWQSSWYQAPDTRSWCRRKHIWCHLLFMLLLLLSLRWCPPAWNHLAKEAHPASSNARTAWNPWSILHVGTPLWCSGWSTAIDARVGVQPTNAPRDMKRHCYLTIFL